MKQCDANSAYRGNVGGILQNLGYAGFLGNLRDGNATVKRDDVSIFLDVIIDYGLDECGEFEFTLNGNLRKL